MRKADPQRAKESAVGAALGEREKRRRRIERLTRELADWAQVQTDGAIKRCRRIALELSELTSADAAVMRESRGVSGPWMHAQQSPASGDAGSHQSLSRQPAARHDASEE